MGRIGYFGMAVCGVATLAMSAGAHADQDRVSATEKGSLLVYSKIELRWNSSMEVIGDTFLTVTNDYIEDVNVQFYFINGDAPDGEGNPGWNNYDNEFTLTADQTKAWNASTGGILGNGDIAPFTALDPDGRDAGDGTGDRILRGYAYGFAVNNSNQQIDWNHLAGTGTLIRYDLGYAWEYNAWGYQANGGEPGDLVGTAGTLLLNGEEYASSFDQLLMIFQAVGSNAYSSGGFGVMTDTDITLHPVSADLVRTGKPVATKAEFTVWNEDEDKFSGLERCIVCWDQTLASEYSVTNNWFLVGNLQSNFGKARIDDKDQGDCDVFFEDGVIADELDPLLGLRATLMTFNMGSAYAASAVNMVGMGTQDDGVIQYAPLSDPPEAPAGADRDNDPFGINGLISKTRIRGVRN